MTIICDEKLIGIWYVTYESRNLLAGLSHKGGGKIEVTYRIRHYRPDPKQDPFNDNDRKVWYGGITHESEADAIARMRVFIATAASFDAGKIYELLRGKDETLEQFTQRLSASPGANREEISDAEYHERYGEPPV